MQQLCILCALQTNRVVTHKWQAYAINTIRTAELFRLAVVRSLLTDAILLEMSSLEVTVCSSGATRAKPVARISSCSAAEKKKLSSVKTSSVSLATLTSPCPVTGLSRDSGVKVMRLAMNSTNLASCSLNVFEAICTTEFLDPRILPTKSLDDPEDLRTALDLPTEDFLVVALAFISDPPPPPNLPARFAADS